MRIKDIYRQKEGKWIDYVELVVLEVGEPEESEFGIVQHLKVVDDVGYEDMVACYAPDDATFFIEPSWEGKRAAFKIRHRNGKLSGCLSEIENPDPKPVGVDEKWEKINFGKCRHGILCAEIQKNGMDSIDKYELKRITELAYFSMHGCVPN